MGDPRHDLGLRAEQAAAAWLERCGWSILARRQRSPHGGEVDILALDPDGVLVALEVRARRSERTGRAGESVDARRVGRMRRTLAAFAAGRPTPHQGLRIDLVTVEPAHEALAGSWRVRRAPDIGAR